MEAPEVPLEHSQDHINEHARESEERWIMGVAVSTAILAAVAAIASLLAGMHINEGMIAQIRASDQWAFYQAKGIKAGVLQTKIDLLKAEGKEPTAQDLSKLEEYGSNKEELSREATDLQNESKAHIARHERLAASVTFFQIAIAISAISVLMKRRMFWFIGLGFGALGIAFLILAHLPVLAG
jgi:hypothetical protein